jgi:type IV secretory pathway protease TraF
MGHEARPVESVVPVQVSVPFTVNVTGSFAMGWFRLESVKVPETVVEPPYVTVAGFTVRIVGSVTERLLVAVAGVS